MIDCYPQNDFPIAVSNFCFPNGIKLSNQMAFCDKENATAAAAAAGKGYNAERERRGALERERIHGGVLAAI